MTDQETGTQTEGQETPKQEEKASLEDLLKEFDQQASSQNEPAATPQPKSEVQVLMDEIKGLKAQVQDLQQGTVESDFGTLADDFMKTLEATPKSRRFMEGYIVRRAQQDPRIEKAFEARRSNPEVWNETKRALFAEGKKDFADAFGAQVDSKVTDDLQAVRSAAKQQPNRAPQQDEEDWKRVTAMSRSEFQDELRKLNYGP